MSSPSIEQFDPPTHVHAIARSTPSVHEHAPSGSHVLTSASPPHAAAASSDTPIHHAMVLMGPPRVSVPRERACSPVDAVEERHAAAVEPEDALIVAPCLAHLGVPVHRVADQGPVAPEQRLGPPGDCLVTKIGARFEG